MSRTKSGDRSRFWIAHSRGANFEHLAAVGFLTLYPSVDDYAFLEVCPENEKWLRREGELCVEFLRGGAGVLREGDGAYEQKVNNAASYGLGVLQTMPYEDLKPMLAVTTDRIKEGSQVEVVRGHAEGLAGVVVEITNQGLLCRLKGFRREYDEIVSWADVVPA